MTDEFKRRLEELIRLGGERRQLYKANQHKVTAKYGNVVCLTRETYFDMQSLEVSEKGEELYSLMNQLDIEEIITIQTIMYLGRDKDYAKEDTPDDILSKKRKHLTSIDKDRDIRTILEKIPFDEYLIDGLEILNIE